MIVKNRKTIKQKIKDLLIPGTANIIPDNFIHILREVLTFVKLSQTQWKILVNLAMRDNLIDTDLFFNLLENSDKMTKTFPKKY